ncbi:MAG: pilus assembly protein [Herbaspirillum sp.]|jgi:type IV pilus assembly protein PilX|nr:pilus assembly protein [Herbaspirillum sp.]
MHHNGQRGAALIIALLMLIVLLMLGIGAMRISLQSEKMSRNQRDRQIAWQAAEAALLDAEYDIGNPASPRYLLFGSPQLDAMAICSRNGAAPGLCRPAANAQQAVWRKMGRADDAPDIIYGRYSGHIMQTGSGPLPAYPPHYLIELLPPDAGKSNVSKPDKGRRYRISALGFGPDQETQVMLQSIYRRQIAAADPTSPPSSRLSWREIAFWGLV